jgi:hypothetical protein
MNRTSDVSVRPSTLELDRRQTRREILRELRLIEGAIALVASGDAPRVTVGGLAFGAQLLPRVAALARQQLVEVHELWSPWSDVCQVEVRLGA